VRRTEVNTEKQGVKQTRRERQRLIDQAIKRGRHEDVIRLMRERIAAATAARNRPPKSLGERGERIDLIMRRVDAAESLLDTGMEALLGALGDLRVLTWGEEEEEAVRELEEAVEAAQKRWELHIKLVKHSARELWKRDQQARALTEPERVLIIALLQQYFAEFPPLDERDLWLHGQQPYIGDEGEIYVSVDHVCRYLEHSRELGKYERRIDTQRLAALLSGCGCHRKRVTQKQQGKERDYAFWRLSERLRACIFPGPSWSEAIMSHKQKLKETQS
jgi:hypothetical protein